MGSGRFDEDVYRSFTRSTAGKSTNQIFEAQTINPNLNPFGVKIRESRDSEDNPNSTPLIVGIDVTGSMGMIADVLARSGLGTLFKGVLERKPITDPHVMFMAIGDANYDSAPLQVSQFEADSRIIDQLTQIYLEHGGGGNRFESYNLPWYFAAFHTVHDSMEKRGKRGYCNAPQAPVWMGDHSFKRIGDIQSGDKVMGWKHVNGRRCIAPSRVIAIGSRRAEVVQATLASGRTVTCTPDHRWLSGYHKTGVIDQMTSVTYKQGGQRADRMRHGILSNVLEPYEAIPPHLAVDAGWLAGIYDGEGFENSICQYRDHNPEVCRRIEEVLTSLGFEWVYRGESYFILGGLRSYVRMLNIPIVRRASLERLISESKHARFTHKDGRPPAMYRRKDPVMHVAYKGEQEVVSMKTTTGNYVISGYASSNCFTVGDEEAPGDLTNEQIKRFIGDDMQSKLSTKDMLEAAQRTYDVFHVIIEEGSHARAYLPRVVESWTSLLGQRVIRLRDHRKLAETIVSAIEVAEGNDAKRSAEAWGDGSPAIYEAVKDLPRGRVLDL